MKLSIRSFGIIISLCVVLFMFVDYWSGLHSFQAFNYNNSWLQGTVFWTSKSETEGNSTNITTDSFKKYNHSKTFNNITIKLNSSFNKSSIVTNQSKRLSSSTPEPSKLLNKSTPVAERRNVTLYVTSHNINGGRLGNQMFKYASLLGIAHAQGRQMFIFPGSDLEKTFNLQYVGYNQTDKK